MNSSINFAFDNSYARLSDQFFTAQNPTPVPEPELIALNSAMAEQLGLDRSALESPEGLAVLAGNAVPPGAEPIATAYAGHQFGGWNPEMGDGRAVLLGEVLDIHGDRQDIQLKGSGRTPYSRGGDGRSALGPVLREFIVSEAMAAMGIPTTRALAAVTTGEPVYREERLPGAVLTRVSLSHTRVGTFQYFAARRNDDALKELTQYVIERHYPSAANAKIPALALLKAVVINQIKLIVHWQSIGFIHGVMNTDNASVAGLTIDYGPCAFMDSFSHDAVFSSIDIYSRYAYKNQPSIAQWNCATLAQCLFPLMGTDEDEAVKLAQGAINEFPEIYTKAYLDTFRKKLGLTTEHSDDAELIGELLAHMQDAKADFTNTFRALSHCAMNSTGITDGDSEKQSGKFIAQFSNNKLDSNSDKNSDNKAIHQWLERWRSRHEQETLTETKRSELMKGLNPAYIPRNHRIEQAIEAAENKDYAPAHRLIAVLENPYTEQEGMEEYALAPTDGEAVITTYCGT